MAKIAIVELSKSHSECIFSQVKFLKENQDNYVDVIINASQEKNINFNDLPNNIFYFKIENGIKNILRFFELRNFILKNKYDIIIFNSLITVRVRNLLMLLPKNPDRYFGIVHNIENERKSFTKNIILKKVSNIFVLSDTLKNKLAKSKNQYNFESFYPIYFPKIESKEIKKPNEIWIGVPGSVEKKRRDYTSLLKSIEKYGVNDNIKFLLLGKYDAQTEYVQKIDELIKKNNLYNKFYISNEFITTSQYLDLISKCDYILPLIHPSHISFPFYKYRISGTFNLAIGFKIPMLMDKIFCDNEDFKDTALFYEQDKLMVFINNIQKDSSSNLFQLDKWNFEYQQSNYLNFIMKELK